MTIIDIAAGLLLTTDHQRHRDIDDKLRALLDALDDVERQLRAVSAEKPAPSTEELRLRRRAFAENLREIEQLLKSAKLRE